MIKLILQHERCSGFVWYRRIEQDFIDQWQMICKIETEQWHCEWRGLRLLPSPPTACAGWERIWWENSGLLCKTEKCLHAAWLFLQCSAVTLVQSVCAHAGNDLTQKLSVKKQHRLRSQSPQSGSSTPEYLNTVLGTRADAGLKHR